MKKRLLKISLFFCALICILISLFLIFDKQSKQEDMRLEQIVQLNEIEQLAKKNEYDLMITKIGRMQENLKNQQLVLNYNIRFLIVGGINILFIFVVFGYVYYAILLPFEKMKKFAQKVAQGNLDIPLAFERTNYFGEFTWAFDSMRREISKARACEKEAIDNNKTVIATLSHDIKTPIASIRAYAEGLEANLDTSIEKRYKYLSILMKKCDEVAKLTNDLFLHSLSDLDKLKITVKPMEIVSVMESVIEDLSVENSDIIYQKPHFTAMVALDKNRFTQLVENLINNARKYAKSKIYIEAVKNAGYIEIHFRDYGDGIPDADMPFIFEKFYRGKNVKGEQGSGLGLYIVKYITEQMKGTILLHNCEDGLEVTVCFPEIQA